MFYNFFFNVRILYFRTRRYILGQEYCSLGQEYFILGQEYYHLPTSRVSTTGFSPYLPSHQVIVWIKFNFFMFPS